MSTVKAVVVKARVHPQAKQAGDLVCIAELGGGSKASKCQQRVRGNHMSSIHLIRRPKNFFEQNLSSQMSMKIDRLGRVRDVMVARVALRAWWVALWSSQM